MEFKKHEYRIREAQAGLQINDIRTFFIPEILISRYNVPLWKFWKKQRVIEIWATFYKEKNGSIRYNIQKWNTDIISVDHICFNTLDDAKKWVHEYKINRKKELEKFLNEFLQASAVNSDLNDDQKTHNA